MPAGDSVPAASARCRLTVQADGTPEGFRARYETAVPPLPSEPITELIRRQAPWSEMLDLVNAVAPFGYLTYHRLDVERVVRLAGDTATGVAYLMGNHTFMERMFRYEPAILLYAPLHTAIWDDPGGPAYFSFDRPNDQFGSFGHPEITAVGRELDAKLVVLLEHLRVAVPGELRA
ncbi:MAG: hypothetical protein ACRDPO_14270 [Streptosporangiaceae bacterium]